MRQGTPPQDHWTHGVAASFEGGLLTSNAGVVRPRPPLATIRLALDKRIVASHLSLQRGRPG